MPIRTRKPPRLPEPAAEAARQRPPHAAARKRPRPQSRHQCEEPEACCTGPVGLRAGGVSRPHGSRGPLCAPAVRFSVQGHPASPDLHLGLSAGGLPRPCPVRTAKPPGPFCGSLPPDGIPMALAGGAGGGGSRSHHPLFSKKGEAEAPRGEEGSLRRHSSSHAWVSTALWRWPRAGTEREAGDRLPEGVSGAGASPERPFQDVAVEWLSPGEGGRKWLALLRAQ